ncbi:MAG: hypothetical protein JWQ43_510 [Glaciihabitans sp.]|nr:hypothetical protein [Glaciihabitans sp.]
MNFSDQVQHARELRADLVDFVAGPRFQRTVESRFAAVRPYLTSDFDAWEQAVDELLFAQTSDETPTLLERFLSTRLNLTDGDIALLELWRDANVQGLFQVQAREDEILDLLNLVDDIHYETYAIEGADSVRTAVRGSYLQARILPVGPAWITSGVLQVFPSRDRLNVGARVARLLQFDPTAAHRNPERVEKARELLRTHHAVFLELFGADLVPGTGAEAAERYRAFLASDAEPAAGIMPFPEELAGSADVAIFHDKTRGVGFLEGYSAVEAAHRDPAGSPSGRDLLDDWLDDNAVAASVLSDLAGRHPHTVDALYRELLQRPDFTWAADGDALLHEHKASWFDPHTLPALAVLPQIALDAVLEQRGTSAR